MGNINKPLIDIKVHAPHLAQWVKSEFDSMVEFGFPDDQLYNDTIETVKMIGGDLKLSDGDTDFYLFSDGTKLKITSSPIKCEVIE